MEIGREVSTSNSSPFRPGKLLGRAPPCYCWRFHFIPPWPLSLRRSWTASHRHRLAFCFLSLPRETSAMDGAGKSYHTPCPRGDALFLPLFFGSLFFFFTSSSGSAGQRKRVTVKAPEDNSPVWFSVRLGGRFPRRPVHG